MPCSSMKPSASGRGLCKLTDTPEMHNEDPQWSPDGRKLAFTRTAPRGNSEIYVMNADGSAQTNISQHRAEDVAPAWAPARSRNRLPASAS